ncbi:MAG: 50S ribosomal protein L11 methyltransferase [Anaerolineae bacterium]|nr:50S ribosomal protein L11 methyltransferase [Anaerolineales bacterium]MCQ3978523.1 50S ribosomal protein L11 methyltransferase [Anaerolineae bacterium]
MDFIEIALTDLNGEAAETVGELFNRYGYGGAVMESYPPNFDKVTVRTVIPSEDDYRLREIELMLALIGQALPGGLPEPRLQFVGKSDWAESWKAHFHPVRVGRRFVIKPSWRDYTATPDDIVIEIDPGLAFGSGLHPTTQLCLKILEEMPLAGQTLFDVGTGSGILALAALKLGAAKVRAVDIDDIAVRVTEENFERNGYPLSGPQKGEGAEVEVAVGSAGEAGGRQWDIVVANILANTIIELLPGLKAALAHGGSLILSGIIAEQEASVTAAATAHGLRFSERRAEEDWVALVFRIR